MRRKEDVQSFLMKKRNQMRKNPTVAESCLKAALELEGIRHVFQSIAFSGGCYRIFDFYFPKHNLVVEVDGEYHDPDYDAMRDKQVNKVRKRCRILRFTNGDVINDTAEVMGEIRAALI